MRLPASAESCASSRKERGGLGHWQLVTKAPRVTLAS
jgi:hypothetical protein